MEGRKMLRSNSKSVHMLNYYSLHTYTHTHARAYLQERTCTHSRTHMHTHLCPVAWRHGSAGVAKVPDVDLALACSRDEEVGLEGVDVQAPHGARVVVRLMNYHVGAPTGEKGRREEGDKAGHPLFGSPTFPNYSRWPLHSTATHVILNTILHPSLPPFLFFPPLSPSHCLPSHPPFLSH